MSQESIEPRTVELGEIVGGRGLVSEGTLSLLTSSRELSFSGSELFHGRAPAAWSLSLTAFEEARSGNGDSLLALRAADQSDLNPLGSAPHSLIRR